MLPALRRSKFYFFFFGKMISFLTLFLCNPKFSIVLTVLLRILTMQFFGVIVLKIAF